MFHGDFMGFHGGKSVGFHHQFGISCITSDLSMNMEIQHDLTIQKYVFFFSMIVIVWSRQRVSHYDNEHTIPDPSWLNTPKESLAYIIVGEIFVARMRTLRRKWSTQVRRTWMADLWFLGLQRI
jgi:hypothetical protein